MAAAWGTDWDAKRRRPVPWLWGCPSERRRQLYGLRVSEGGLGRSSPLALEAEVGCEVESMDADGCVVSA